MSDVAPLLRWARRVPQTGGAPRSIAGQAWLEAMLQRNAGAQYLKRFGSPTTLQAFRRDVPICDYDGIADWILQGLRAEARDVLFAGRVVACERTGGSSGGPKWIPYSAHGLRDFRRAVLPWLACSIRRHAVSGTVYFATSPATRPPQTIGGIPVGVSDAAYLGTVAASAVLAQSAVMPEVAAITDIAQWRQATLTQLRAARDLQWMSVWSPTFLLELLDEIPDAQTRWPQLKAVSAWADAASAPYAAELAQRLPHAILEPKGLLSTEGVVSVPDASGRAVLTAHNFVEFAQAKHIVLADALRAGECYEVILTTASGLYRYRTGDGVRCIGHDADGRPALAFEGRQHVSDLVGEKLSETFVARCLAALPGLVTLLADAHRPGYVLLCDRDVSAEQLHALDRRLQANPQYAYARALGQLAPLRASVQPQLRQAITACAMRNGTRLADIKPMALRRGAHWQALLETTPHVEMC